jgi:outer membrane biosynthesis protein TonB
MTEDFDRDETDDGVTSQWGTRFRRRASRPSKSAVIGSLLLHGAGIAALILAGVTLRAQEPEFVQYKVKLKSPPAQVLGPPEPVANTTPVVSTPEPAPAEPKAADKPAPPKPAPKTQSAQNKPIEKPADPKPAQGPDPKPVEIGGEDIDIDIAGENFAYPEYLENIALTLRRYFRPPEGSRLEAEVMFFIRRDGSTGGVAPKRKSGSFDFDVKAIQAVEAAGKAKAFGPLPPGLQGDRLWISFTFKPAK